MLVRWWLARIEWNHEDAWLRRHERCQRAKRSSFDADQHVAMQVFNANILLMIRASAFAKYNSIRHKSIDLTSEQPSHVNKDEWFAVLQLDPDPDPVPLPPPLLSCLHGVMERSIEIWQTYSFPPLRHAAHCTADHDPVVCYVECPTPSTSPSRLGNELTPPLLVSDVQDAGANSIDPP